MKAKSGEGKIKFAVLAIDVVCFRIIKKELNVLLGEVNAPPYYENELGLIGGLIKPKETAEQAVSRHLKDKVGISGLYKEQLYTFSQVKRDPRGRVVSVAYLAFTSQDPRNLKKASLKSNWITINNLPRLAYDHNEIIKIALERLRSRIEYTNIARYFLPEKFTLTQLQETYETILDKKIDKRNFRRKICRVSMVKKTGKTLYGKTTRPAALYKFSDKKTMIYEIF